MCLITRVYGKVSTAVRMCSTIHRLYNAIALCKTEMCPKIATAVVVPPLPGPGLGSPVGLGVLREPCQLQQPGRRIGILPDSKGGSYPEVWEGGGENIRVAKMNIHHGKLS